MCFNQDGAILLNDKPLKLVDQFIYLGSNISSIEINVNIFMSNALTATDRLTTILKYDHCDRTGILPSSNYVYYCMAAPAGF